LPTNNLTGRKTKHMHPTEIKIRNASLGDLDVIIKLLRATELPTDGVTGAMLASYLVAEQDHSIVGVAGLERYGEYGLLRSVAVAPSRRNFGIATRLTEAILERAKIGGVREIFLLTTTAESYFPRYGFEVIERQEVPPEVHESSEFASVCPASAVAMRLKFQ
jgi:amino-acid N-acetyltransferase